MMNKYLLLVALFVVCSCSPQKKNNTLNERGIKGQVQSITTYVYDAKMKFGEIQKYDEPKKIIVSQYDENGCLLEETTYIDARMRERDILGMEKYTYDADCNMLSKTSYGYDGEQYSKEECSYDKGLLTSWKRSFSGVGRTTQTITWDSKGWVREIQETSYSEDGEVKEVNPYLFTYSKNEYDAVDISDSKYDCVLLHDGERIVACKTAYFNCTFDFDKNGLCIGGALNEVVFSVAYNQYGDLVKAENYDVGNGTSVYFQLINIKDIISGIYEDYTTTIVYEYDKSNNWTVAKLENEEISYWTNKKKRTYEIVERRISYRP